MSAHRRRWSDDHGKLGLRDKFSVYKTKDRARLPNETRDSYRPSARIGGPGPDDEFVFVLRPETDRAAWVALDEYASRVYSRDPKLAYDIRERLADIYRRNQEAPQP